LSNTEKEKGFFPINSINYITAFNFHQRGKKKGISIYLIVLLLFTAAIIALPFITVDITFQSRGQIRPVTESNAIIANLPAKVKIVHLTENQAVKKGATLLVLNTEKLDEQIALNQNKLEESKGLIADLKELTQHKNNYTLNTLLYQKEWQEYTEQLYGLKTKQNHFKQELTRSNTLYEKGVIAKTENLKATYDYNTAKSELSNFKNNQLSSWQNQLQQYSQDTTTLKSQIQQIVEDKQQYVITAPISGTIKNYSGIKAGNFVVPNQTLAEISPNGNLIVECYVSPKDISYLKKGMLVNFQIDAYNYNQWGLAKGKVIEVFNDITIINEQPIFKVRCQLITQQLQLKSGFVGNLKKGMTLTGRFKVTERTLWQLLYDKMDDWLNPMQSVSSSAGDLLK